MSRIDDVFKEQQINNRMEMPQNPSIVTSIQRRGEIEGKSGIRVVSDYFEGSVATSQGVKVGQLIRGQILDCGHEHREGMMIYECWRGHLLCHHHKHVCPSGRVVCESHGCGKYIWDKWYSTWWQFLLDVTIGCKTF